MNPSLQTNGDLLTIGQLAAHFGWSPRIIEGLVRGERLPAVEIDGQWQFRREQVLDWLELKILTLDTARVNELESKLEHSLLADGTFRTRRSDRLASRLPLRGIALDVPVSSKAEVLRALAELAEGTGLVFEKEFLLASLIERESLCSTALPGGVAICHPRRSVPSAIERQFLCFLRSATPVDFGADDGEGTSNFFLLCAPDDRAHLHGLARLARILHVGGLDAVKSAATTEEIKEALATVEGAITTQP
jgi:mannitol/fructose-specific phosphotransferase system IIA component (Ntr-type)